MTDIELFPDQRNDHQDLDCRSSVCRFPGAAVEVDDDAHPDDDDRGEHHDLNGLETVEDEHENRPEILDWAVRYVAKGFAVLPVYGVDDDGNCGCGKPHDTDKLPTSSIGKHPVGGLSWSDGSTDIAVIERWFHDGKHNIAIVPALSAHVRSRCRRWGR